MFSLLLSSLELSGTKVYEPYMRARLGTTAILCKPLVLELGDAGTARDRARDLKTNTRPKVVFEEPFLAFGL